jgi:hypothetical protein
MRGKRIGGLVRTPLSVVSNPFPRLQISAPLGHCLSFVAYLLSAPHCQSGTAPAQALVCEKLLSPQ